MDQQNGQWPAAIVPSPAFHWRGTSWDKKFQCYRARIYYEQKQRHIGRYTDPLEAARAYDKAAVYLYGNSAITNFGLEACRRDPTEVSSYIVKAKLLADEQRQCMAAGQPCSQQQQALPQLPSIAPMQQHTQAGQSVGAVHGAPGGVMVQGSMWVAAPQQQQQSQQQPVMLMPASSSCASAAFISNSSSSNSSETLASYFLPAHHQQQEGMLSAGRCAATAGMPTTVLQAPSASAPQLQGGHFPAVLGPAASSSSCLISTQTGLQVGPVMPVAGADAVLLQPQAAGGPPHAWRQQPQQQQTGFYQTLYSGPAQMLLQSGGSPAGSSYAVWQPCSPAVNCGEPTSFTVAQQQVSTAAVTPLEQQLVGLSLTGGLQQNVSQFAPMQHTMLQQAAFFSAPSALQQIQLQ